MSVSDASSPISQDAGRCFCGKFVESLDSGIYCSQTCAYADSFNALCHKQPQQQQQTQRFPNYIPPPSSFPAYFSTSINTQSSTPSSSTTASTSQPLSRNPSSNSSTSHSHSHSNSVSPDHTSASHYRKLARPAESKEERRRKRLERSSGSTNASSASLSTSTSISRVPDLVGSSYHSRNGSVASTCSSVFSAGLLSRNTSNASTRSARGLNMGVGVGIGGGNGLELLRENEEEVLIPEQKRVRAATGGLVEALGRPQRQRRRLSIVGDRSLEKCGLESDDMRDMLDEILGMEKDFEIKDVEEEDVGRFGGLIDQSVGFIPVNRNIPPRTPSPVNMDKRISNPPQAPGAPLRNPHAATHRRSLSQYRMIAPIPRGRPSSTLLGLHQSSLSESHTALYLATASPERSSTNRRSASPKLAARQSISFTPESAGPGLQNLRPKFDIEMNNSPSSISNRTPSRRRFMGGVGEATMHHPTMDGWRFPTPNKGGSASNTATPTKPKAQNINANSLFPGPQNMKDRNPYSTPVSAHIKAPMLSAGVEEDELPQLLWPREEPLAPALFPCSPAEGTPVGGFAGARGLRLEFCLDLGEDDDEVEGEGDVEMEDEGERIEFPVYVQGEGFGRG